MKVVDFPSMCHIFQISLGRQENSLLNMLGYLFSDIICSGEKQTEGKLRLLFI